MIVVVLIGADPGLRGHLTRWMTEIAPGVYVGRVSARVREAIWVKISDRIREGQVVMIYPARNEQGWKARNAGTDRYAPIELDGLTFFLKHKSD